MNLSLMHFKQVHILTACPLQVTDPTLKDKYTYF